MKRSMLNSLRFAPGYFSNAREIVKHASRGFDSLRAGILHGKIDTISYDSKTVGIMRRAIVYIPPGYSKKKIPGLISFAWHWWR